MIKNLTMSLMALFLMGGVAMAQDGPRGGQAPDPAEMAQKMTEQMVQKYGLDETQQASLLEVNQAWVEKMAQARPQRPEGQGAPQELTEEQRQEMDAARKAQMEEMKTAREAYEEQIKGILTEEQFAAYQKDQQNRKGGKGGRGGRRGPGGPGEGPQGGPMGGPGEGPQGGPMGGPDGGDPDGNM